MLLFGGGVGSKPGQLKFYVNERALGTSTFEKKWIQSQRLSGLKWNKTIIVNVTTLDELIKEYGVPKFCKIDVEGFEYNVLKGLHHKIEYISFEFSGEFLTEINKCVRLLEKLGKTQYNYSINENYELASKKWLSSRELIKKIQSMHGKDLCGDIYAKTEMDNS